MVRKIANICENIFTPGPKSPEPFEFLQFTQAGILNSDPGLGMSPQTTLIILHYFKNLIEYIASCLTSKFLKSEMHGKIS